MKIERLIAIIMILLEHKKITAKKLAETFEVSLRTIYRDIESINSAGIPIMSISGINGGISIMEEYKLDKKVFSSSDIAALITGLNSVACVLDTDEIKNALIKIESIMPKQHIEEIILKSNQVVIDMTPWITNKNTSVFMDIIKHAIQKHCIINFDYESMRDGYSHKTVEPHSLVLKNNHWYMHAYSYDNNEFRLFKVTRISNILVEDKTFVVREIPSTINQFTNLMAQKEKAITLRIDISLKDRMLDYCSKDSFILDGNKHYLVSFPFIADDYGYNLLLGFGDKCECIEPLEIRKEFLKRIETMYKLYMSD